MKATRRRGVIAAEERRRAAGIRGDERWWSGGWLQDQRIPDRDGGPDEWKPTRKANAVLALLRREFGEDGFSRLFGYDSPRWQQELRTRCGQKAGDARLGAMRRKIATREFHGFGIGWAREILTLQEVQSCGAWEAAGVLAKELAN